MITENTNRKEVSDTIRVFASSSKLSEEIQHQLQVRTVFTIADKYSITESVVISWIIIAIVLVICLILGSNLKVHNISRRQAFAEMIVTKLQDIVKGMIGEEGKRYVPYLTTVLLYIGFSNIIGLIGLKCPTKDLNITATLAIMSILLIEGSCIRAKKIKGWFKGKCEPIALIAPLNFLEIVIRPLSLCMRLFGNVLGAFVIMELLKAVCPFALPVPFSLYFDIFDGLIQAYVFVFLTSLFIKEGIE